MKYIEPIELDMAYRAYNEREDVKLAISLYETAAKKNSVKAIESLVSIYLNEGMIANSHKWIEKIIQEAENDKTDFQLALSNLHFSKNIPDANNEIGFDFLLKAAANCNSDAQYMLSSLYCSGLYQIERSIDKASYWLRRAYKNRHPAAIYEVACFYMNEEDGIKKAMSLLRESSDLGFDQAKDALYTKNLWIKR